MYKGDEDRYRLKEASKLIGIKEKLDKLNNEYVKKNPHSFHKPFGYYALSPSWNFNKKDFVTKYNVIYWLNPQNQQDISFGWFTVEDLEDWIQGKGKILNKGAKNAVLS